MAAGILAATSRITVGLGTLLLPLHGAARLAEGIRAITSFAPDRLRVIMGLGWRQIEYETTGVDRRQRGRLMDQYAEALFDGAEADKVRGAALWFGGSAPAMLKRAARFGASFCHTFSPAHLLAERVELWRSQLGPVRPGQAEPKSTFSIDAWVDRNSARCDWIRQRMREPWRFYAEMDSLSKDVTGNPVGVEATIDMLNSYSVVGSPEQVIEQMAPYTKVADGAVFRIWCDAIETELVDECLMLLAHEVAPALRAMR
jgi:alkanesulfonate monooxygenase SsuD/methylene tetrahydromethanopterin reductase-like flavin-dependent oxidoreductase (luciferase family)